MDCSPRPNTRAELIGANRASPTEPAPEVRATDTCPTCGSDVRVYTADEGTQSFEPVRATDRDAFRLYAQRAIDTGTLPTISGGELLELLDALAAAEAKVETLRCLEKAALKYARVSETSATSVPAAEAGIELFEAALVLARAAGEPEKPRIAKTVIGVPHPLIPDCGLGRSTK